MSIKIIEGKHPDEVLKAAREGKRVAWLNTVSRVWTEMAKPVSAQAVCNFISRGNQVGIIKEQESMSDHDNDLAICEAATPGPWGYAISGLLLHGGTLLGDVRYSADGKFIAHFNPQKVRGLLERVEELEGECKRLWSLLDDVSTAGDMFKPDCGRYFKYVNGKAECRDGLFYSDGYSILPKGPSK